MSRVTKRFLSTFLMAVAVVMLVTSCSKKNAAGKVETTGDWLGFIIDGTTTDKLNFFGDENDELDEDSTDHVYVISKGEVKLAGPCSTGDANELNGISIDGCVTATGLPTEVVIPIFVQRSGYHPFASTMWVNAHVSDDNDLIVGDPSEYDNIRLFPTANNYDVTINTTLDDQAIAGVTVRCVFNGQNALDIVGWVASNYLSPVNDFPNVVSGDTDADGRVTFAGSTLTKGGEYVCFAHKNDLVNGQVISDGGDTLEFTVGVDGPNHQFELSINNDDPDDVFNATSVNYSRASAMGSLTAALKINLNQPAIVFPGTEDCQTMYLDDNQSDGVDGIPIDFEDDVDDASGSENAESVTVAVNAAGNQISLTPVLAAGSSTDDIAPQFGFGGLYIMPVAGPNVGSIYYIDNDETGTNFALDTRFGGSSCGSINTENCIWFSGSGNCVDNVSLMQ